VHLDFGDTHTVLKIAMVWLFASYVFNPEYFSRSYISWIFCLGTERLPIIPKREWAQDGLTQPSLRQRITYRTTPAVHQSHISSIALIPRHLEPIAQLTLLCYPKVIFALASR
jgi:hypothetical protein